MYGEPMTSMNCWSTTHPPGVAKDSASRRIAAKRTPGSIRHLPRYLTTNLTVPNIARRECTPIVKDELTMSTGS